ncbi:MAG: hypothetical protein LQ340_003736 [Diploschistes diacapsis]|nr:MAG: hypothetical protein LQ340_003736 [Diploschistes diacapsis]
MSRSSPWSRLKPVQQDALEAVGLPSKGDSKLLNYKFQETYYAKIVPRYMGFCASAGRDINALNRAFASMNLDGAGDYLQFHGDIANGRTMPDRNKELGVLLMAMRKLREGIVGSGRIDPFAARAYMFIIRAAILTSTFESYHPAILHLLNVIHLHTPLSSSELHEFVGYHILDVACRLKDFAEAFKVRNRWRYKDERVEGIVLALIRDDWINFWRLKNLVDGYQRAFMAWAEGNVRKHALKCLGKAYFTAEQSYVERCSGRNWDALKAMNGVAWELEQNKVVIRRIKGRK